MTPFTRRTVLRAAAALTAGLCVRATAAQPRALIAIMLNLEMSRGFPTPEDTHWDFEKGNLDEPSKQYTVELARRVKTSGGGIVHGMLVGEVLEQPDITWIKQLLAEGHRFANHTWQHIDIFARDITKIQPRFTRSPELLKGKELLPFIRDNIVRTETEFTKRTGAKLIGFRSPSEGPAGLTDRPDLQQLLKELGYTFVVTKYPRTNIKTPGEESFAALVKAQADAQPFVYPNGLLELPICPATDIHAIRSSKWPVDDFREATRRCVERAIATGTSFRFTGHPSCLNVVDPNFTVIDTICQTVAKAGDRAAIVGLDTIAEKVRSQK